MPGHPAAFTQRTVIVVSGKSGIGKSTLCNYLCGTNIASYNVDKLFIMPFNTNSGAQAVDIDILSQYLQKFPQPACRRINNISPLLVKEKVVLDAFINICAAELNYLFSTTKSKVILLEGFTLALKEVRVALNAYFAQQKWRAWYLIHSNDIQTVG